MRMLFAYTITEPSHAMIATKLLGSRNQSKIMNLLGRETDGWMVSSDNKGPSPGLLPKRLQILGSNHPFPDLGIKPNKGNRKMSDNLPQKSKPYHVEQATNKCNNEPWYNDDGVVRDCEGNDLTEILGSNDEELKDRIVALMNALAGCPDPQAFVEAVKALLETARNYDIQDWKKHDYEGEYSPDDSIDDEALSWLKSENKPTKEGE